MKEKLYTRIEDYINGQLTGQDLVDFENLMNADVEFADEVQLHRSLHESFGDPAKAKLRNSLDLMREEFKDTKAEEDKVVAVTGKKGRQGIWWLAAASLLLLGLSWWFLIQKPADGSGEIVDTDPKDGIKEVEKQLPIPKDDTTIPDPKQKEDNEIVNTNFEQNIEIDDPENNSNPNPVADPTPPPPSIDYFAPNTVLASVINNIEDQRTHKFNVQIPAKNESISTSNGTVALYFKGELISFDYPENEKFVLTIYDNQSDSYNKKQAVYTTDIDFTKVEGPIGFGGEEDFTFVVDKPVKMKAGLYYYLIQLSEQNLVGGSFFVKEN